MEKEKMESLILDYIDGNLDGELKQFVETQIDKNPDYSRFYHENRDLIALLDSDTDEEPPSRIADNFHQVLEEQIVETKVVPMSSSTPAWMKIAAAVSLLVVGFLSGKVLFSPDQDEMQALKDEMSMTRQLVSKALDESAPASERLQSVRVSYQVESADSEILATLINTMNNDENVNVRLAAIKGLSRFTEEASVRTALVNTLEVQTDPIIQVFLINVLVEIQEKSALEGLKKLTEDEGVNETVRDEAQLGIFELS